jgi:hypothetical protein
VLPCLALFYLATKPNHVGANVDGLACSLHRSMVSNRQRGGLCHLIGAALSHHAAVGDGAFPRGVKPPGLDI